MNKLMISITLSALATSAFAGGLDCTQFPHWPNCSATSNNPTSTFLGKINNLIQENKGKADIVLFDWDGTSYNEQVTVNSSAGSTLEDGNQFSGEANFHIWGMKNHLFPDYAGAPVFDGVQKIAYYQGKTSVSISGYNSFSQEATVEAGLTPAELSADIIGPATPYWMQQHPAKSNAFLPTLDLMQQFINNGFSVWVITGSNPYFVMNEMKSIDDTVQYTNGDNYNLLPNSCLPTSTAPNLADCHIIGNGAKLGSNGLFTAIYDNRFVKRPQTGDYNNSERYYIDGPGKAVAIRNYLEKAGTGAKHIPVLFYAGNSGGDYESIVYTLENNPNAMSMAINPRGSLLDLVNEYGHASASQPQRLFQVSIDFGKAGGNTTGTVVPASV